MRRRRLSAWISLVLLLIGVAATFAPLATRLGQTSRVSGGCAYQNGAFLIDCGDGARLEVDPHRRPEGCVEAGFVQFRVSKTEYGSPYRWKMVWNVEVVSVSDSDLPEQEVVTILTRDLPKHEAYAFADLRPVLDSGRTELIQIDRSAAYRNGLARLRRWAGPLMALLILLVLASVIGGGFLRRREQRRIAHGQCSRCGYDLKGITSPVCPECGWERRRDTPCFRDG